MILLGELRSDHELVRAIERLRAHGHERLDAYAPHEIEGLSRALGQPRSSVPRWALVGGITGLLSAYSCQWSISEVAWPHNVGGRPLHSAPAFIPITFELTILGASLATLLALVILARLGVLYRPLDEVDALRDATLAGYWVLKDPDLARAKEHLSELGALRVVEVP